MTEPAIQLSCLRASKANSNKLEQTASSRYNPKQKETLFWRSRKLMRYTLLAAALVCCLVLLTSVSASSNSKKAPAPPKELYSCINDNQPDQQLTTYKDFAYQKPARWAASRKGRIGAAGQQLGPGWRCWCQLPATASGSGQ